MDEVPSIRRFREAVDNIAMRKRDRLLIKSLYLTASRVSELVTHVEPWDQKNGKVRLAFGSYNKKYSITTFDYEKLRHKVLLLTLALAKRKAKTRKTKTEEQRLKLKFKTIALPCGSNYEPWVRDILPYIMRRGTLNFDLSRHRVRQIIRENLHPLDKEISTHHLRHYRLTHLAEDYKLDAEDLIQYAGWTFKAGLGIGSGQLDTYIHSRWTRYFPKLLKPL